MCKKITYMIIFLLFVFFNKNVAQEVIFFENNQPNTFSISDIRSTVFKLEHGYINDIGNYYFAQGYQDRMLVSMNIGESLPLISFKKNNDFVFFSMPVGWKLLIDMYEAKTSPVINNDYWFGTQVYWIHKTNSKPIKNFSILINPFYHESTHIGDEFALHGISQMPDFRRINFSYEAWTFQLGVNDIDTLANSISLRLGFRSLLPTRDAYFSVDTIESPNFSAGTNNYKTIYWLQINMKTVKTPIASSDFQAVFSADIRNRIKFAFIDTESEKRIWSVNIYVGYFYKPSNKKSIGLFFRYYKGVNPYGQFRDIDNFSFKGISVVYY